MSDIDHAMEKLQALLISQYRAEGEELHQLVASCETRLPHEVLVSLKALADAHEQLELESNSESDIERFLQEVERCIHVLTPRANRFIWRLAWSLLSLFTLGCLLFYYFYWDWFSI